MSSNSRLPEVKIDYVQMGCLPCQPYCHICCYNLIFPCSLEFGIIIKLCEEIVLQINFCRLNTLKCLNQGPLFESSFKTITEGADGSPDFRLGKNYISISLRTLKN